MGDGGRFGEERCILIQRTVRLADLRLLVVASGAAILRRGIGALCTHDTAAVVKKGVLGR